MYILIYFNMYLNYDGEINYTIQTYKRIWNE